MKIFHLSHYEIRLFGGRYLPFPISFLGEGILEHMIDVPDSWVIPSIGVKCNDVLGRLNQISILVQREGIYYGHCNEICGTNHTFTPIFVEVVSRKDYADRVYNQLSGKLITIHI